MDEPQMIVETSHEYIGRWNRLISTTNWEKGRIISQWREAMQESDMPASSYTDDAWAEQVGNITPQHVGRLRRVHDRFAQVHDQYAGLFWSHFQAALEWSDAEMWLEGAVQSQWSVAQMRTERWEHLGAVPEEEPRAADVVASDWNEDIEPIDDGPTARSSSAAAADADRGAPFGGDEAADYDPDDDYRAEATLPSGEVAAVATLRPFQSLPALPKDLKDAFEQFKLAILAHKVAGWREISCDDVLAVLDSLKQLALAPAE